MDARASEPSTGREWMARLHVAMVAGLALAPWKRHGPRPLTFYFDSSYAVGLVLSIGTKLI